MPQRLSPGEAVAAIARHAPQGRVFLSAGPAEPLALHGAWARAPNTAAGLRFAGLFIPGLNRFDYARLHPTAGMNLFMLSPDWRGGFASGQSRHRPMHYAQAFATLVGEGAEVGIFHVSTPDGAGRASFGVAADAPPAMLDRCGWRLALVNRTMPHAAGAPAISLDVFDAIVEVDHPLAELADAGATGGPIAARVAELVRDGDTIQTGVGKLPAAVTYALSAHRHLRVHSGLLTQGHLALAEAGAIEETPGAITGGIGAGDAAFYGRLSSDPRVRLVPVPQTHAHAVLAGIENLVAINAALEIDLFGQINAELTGGGQISGVGGLVDFVRGAKAAPGGRAIVMIQAEGRGASRIVPWLSGPVTVSRVDAPIVVTEHGTVDLAPLDIDARAAALTTLAAPAHRDVLAAAWREMRAAL